MHIIIFNHITVSCVYIVCLKLLCFILLLPFTILNECCKEMSKVEGKAWPKKMIH